jgi:prolyl oligopeptidase
MSAFAELPPYPPSPRAETVEEFHGKRLADPYSWLEDLDSPQVARWIQAQNVCTEKALSASPWRPALRDRLAQLQRFERRVPVACSSGTLYYWRQSGERAQPTLCAEPLAGGAERQVLDVTELSADGTVAVAEVSISPDGRWLAYAVSDGGSDWLQWRVRSLQTMRDEPDRLDHARFGTAVWLREGSGFVYGCYPEKAPERHAAVTGHTLRLHRLGTAQQADEVVYRRPDRPYEVYTPHISPCGRWLVVCTWDGSARNRVWRVDLQDPARATAPLLDEGDAAYTWVGGADRGELLFLTDALGGNGAVVAIHPERPGRPQWRILVPPGAERLESAALAGRHLVWCTLSDGASRLHRMGVEGGAAQTVPLPSLGTASGFVAEDRASPRAEAGATLHFNFMSFTVAPMVMRLSGHGDEQPRAWFDPPRSFDGSAYETVLEWARSADGTAVPIHLTRRRGLALDGRSPCLLLGYGGFGLSQRPSFVASRIAWLEMGGVLVQAMLRGGGEYGRAWHDAARLQDKPRTFEDFIGVAEHLIRSGHTQPRLLVAHGASNGGLTAAASVLARPDLFGALVAAVPILDMLRYHRFGMAAAWAADYGRSDVPEHFAMLARYSPVHTVRPGQVYPATMLLTAERDDRVHPAHAFKFAAAMQHAQPSAAGQAGAVLLRVEPRSGHGPGKSLQADVHEKADLYTFIAEAIGMSRDGAGPPPIWSPGALACTRSSSTAP